MLDISICYAQADREIALAVAARLSMGAEANVSMDECSKHGLPSSWTGSAVVLALSSNSVPVRFDRAEWAGLLDHSTASVACLMIDECAYPPLFERKNFYRWNAGSIETLRAMERWAIGLRDQPEQAGFTPARLPWFEGRQRELDLLWQTLVDRAGTVVLVQPEPGSGKTSLAQEFARQALAHFREIRWNAPGGDGRILHVLDDVSNSLPFPISADSRASVLMTTRFRDLEVLQNTIVIELEKCSAPMLRFPEEPEDVRLWKSMAACRADGFPLELAVRIADIPASKARSACERLAEFRLLDPFDEDGPRLRLNAFSIAAAGATHRRRHAEVLRQEFCRWAKYPERCALYLGEIESAFQWSLSNDWPGAVELAKNSLAFLKAQGLVAAGVQRLKRLGEAAELRGDHQTARECTWELSWIDHEHEVEPPAPANPGMQLGFHF